jgi:hypothetical protein
MAKSVVIMSDHIDGPRTIADPSIDLTDLFAFTQPSDSKRLVLIADVFPFAGETGVFSNAASYSVVVRRVRITGRGVQSNIESFGQEIRFTFNFEVLGTATTPNVSPNIQHGSCTLPNGEVVPLVVGDENGSYSQDRSIRIFAGVRSDPFYIGWVLNTMKAVPNYLEDDNVMGLAVELDINQFLPIVEGTLFGVVAETSPRNRGPETLLVPRYDWVGRPEQTNFIINAIPNSVDLRDLWNQQTPFAAVSSDVSALFKNRLRDSFEFWDMRDGKRDWDPASLDAHVNIRMNDFLVFDVSKPITNTSHLEIEQSTIEGKPYVTGGGRTLDANVMDILVTYLINRNQGKFYQSPATQATQPGRATFPYLAPPNKKILKISESVELSAKPEAVWSVVGRFDGLWNPLIASINIIGSGVGQLREIETIDGKSIVERLDSIDDLKKTLSYSLVSGIPAKPYSGVIQVSPLGTGSKVTWSVHYRPSGQGELIVHMIIRSLVTRGFKTLQDLFGVTK